METRSKTRADPAATESVRVQRERRQRSPRSARPGLAATDDGASALPSSSSIRGDVAQPSHDAERLDARTSSQNEGDVKARPSKPVSSIHSNTARTERTHSSRSAATVRAQKLALEAEAMRRQVERERELARQQADRERQQAELEFELARQQAVLARKQAEAEAQRERELAGLESEAEQMELQARLAALEASDKEPRPPERRRPRTSVPVRRVPHVDLRLARRRRAGARADYSQGANATSVLKRTTK
ncbi:tol-Pal system protein TolA-like [Leguminivora glycinivorella]|uniref:tol-Pal system protein TolA-like n=1 Tax=Leguminivora glycinivorella TaxID=1035111 RepID=UPI00200BE7E8|nr:tol-Pal system protein TolA-like [Leguminivora glycinivorella]